MRIVLPSTGGIDPEDIVAAGNVVTGNKRWEPDGDAGTYPTTEDTQAADAAALDPAKIQTGEVLLPGAAPGTMEPLPAASGQVIVTMTPQAITLAGDLRTVAYIIANGTGSGTAFDITSTPPDLSATGTISLLGAGVGDAGVIALCDLILGYDDYALTTLDVRYCELLTLAGMTVSGEGAYADDPRGSYTAFQYLDPYGWPTWTQGSWWLGWNTALERWELIYVDTAHYVGGNDPDVPTGVYQPINDEVDDPVTVAGDGWDGDWTVTSYYRLARLIRDGVTVYYVNA